MSRGMLAKNVASKIKKPGAHPKDSRVAATGNLKICSNFAILLIFQFNYFFLLFRNFVYFVLYDTFNTVLVLFGTGTIYH
jgi:hypothetical protein